MRAPVQHLRHPTHRKRVAVQPAGYFALHLVNVVGSLAQGTDTRQDVTDPVTYNATSMTFFYAMRVGLMSSQRDIVAAGQ